MNQDTAINNDTLCTKFKDKLSITICLTYIMQMCNIYIEYKIRYMYYVLQHIYNTVYKIVYEYIYVNMYISNVIKISYDRT